MDEALAEIRHNLRSAGQLDLAGALVPESISGSEVHRALEYSRYLIAINGSRSVFAARVRAEILAVLWGYADHQDDGESLRVHILIAVEKLVREHPDIESIHEELLVLATAYEVSFIGSYDLHELWRLVQRADFDGLEDALYGLCPGTKSYIQVFGRAYHYHNTGSMNGIAYNQALPDNRAV